MAWPRAERVIVGRNMGIAIEPVRFPTSKRYHIRGKVYLIEGDLEILEDRIRKETTVF